MGLLYGADGDAHGCANVAGGRTPREIRLDSFVANKTGRTLVRPERVKAMDGLNQLARIPCQFCRYKKSATLNEQRFNIWCRWPDSNWHGSPHHPLKVARLPISPHRLKFYCTSLIPVRLMLVLQA